MRSSFETLKMGRGANCPNRTVLALESHLYTPSEADCKSGTYTPLQEPQYSRFRLTIIEKKEHSTIAPFANIPANVVDEIIGNYKEAVSVRTHIKYIVPTTISLLESRYGQVLTMLESFLKDKVPNNLSNVSEPYTCQFPFGSWRGKTIPEAIGQAPSAESIKALQSQRDFLGQNLSKYPANGSLLKEIDRALKEIREGAFQKEGVQTTPSSPCIVIYDAQKNYLKSRIDSENRVFCYGITILCDTKKDMPWEISVYNGYCPMEIEPKTGKELPRFSSMSNRIQATFHMSDAEAAYFFGWMERNRAEFINLHYPAQLKKAIDMQAEAIASSK